MSQSTDPNALGIYLSRRSTLPEDSAARKAIPLVTGLLDYFPAALAAVAEVSRLGNEKHNPGEPLHHSRGKSSDHADCIGRHLIDRGQIDPEDGQRHSAKVAWRALALLQEELEAAGAPLARGARDDSSVMTIPEMSTCLCGGRYEKSYGKDGRCPACQVAQRTTNLGEVVPIHPVCQTLCHRIDGGRWVCAHNMMLEVVPPPDPFPLRVGTGG